jgi:hypothetical protein
MTNGLTGLFARIGPKLAGIVLEQQAEEGGRKADPEDVLDAAALLPETGADVWFVVDQDGRFAAASAALQRLLRTVEQDLLGRPYTDVVVDLRQVLERGGSGLVSLRAGDEGVHLAQLSVSADEGGIGGPLRVGVLTRVPSTAAAVRDPLPPPLPPPAAKTAQPSGEGGSAETIDLDTVRAALGARWPVQAERAKAIARAIIVKRLTAADVFAEVDGDRFVICFASLSAEAARLKTSLITREIQERLLGARPDPLPASPRAEPQSSQPVHDRQLVSALSRHLDAACAEGRRAAAAAVGELLSAADLMLSPVLARTMQPTGLVAARLGIERLPWLTPVDAGDGDAKLAFELDALLLTLVLKHIYRGLAAGGSDSVIVPVSSTTLSERRFSQEFIGLCRGIDHPARGRILFELHGLAPDIAPSRLEQLLSCLAPFSAHRVVRVANPQQRLGGVSRCRQTMVSMIAERSQGDAGAARTFDAFATSVHHGSAPPVGTNGTGCRLWVRDARDAETAAWYIAHGADFVSVLWHATPGSGSAGQARAGDAPDPFCTR